MFDNQARSSVEGGYVVTLYGKEMENMEWTCVAGLRIEYGKVGIEDLMWQVRQNVNQWPYVF